MRVQLQAESAHSRRQHNYAKRTEENMSGSEK
jgi:hypothetical protein